MCTKLLDARAQLQELALGLGFPKQGTISLQADTIRISNDSQRGAMSLSMMVELAEIVIALAANPPGLVWIQGTEGSFCSGGNLREVRGGLYRTDAGRTMCEAMTIILDGLRGLPCLSVAVIDGPALGGGAELLTAVDFRVASARARVGFVHSTLGVSPGWGGAARLMHMLGRQRALFLLATGQVVGGEDLIDAGLVDHYSPDIDTAVMEFSALVDKPAMAQRAIKSALGSWKRVNHEECRAFASVWGGAAHRQALGIKRA